MGSQSGWGRGGTGSVRVIFIALLVVILFIPAAQLLQNFPMVALPAPPAVRVLLLPVTCKFTESLLKREQEGTKYDDVDDYESL